MGGCPERVMFAAALCEPVAGQAHTYAQGGGEQAYHTSPREKEVISGLGKDVYIVPIPNVPAQNEK